jgi:RNA polymerase sigma-70 factor (ECF subfamily)
MVPFAILSISDDNDRDFMKRLYISQYNIMRREAYRVLNRTDVLDDIIQDACLKLIDKIPTLKLLDCCRLHSYVVLTVRSVSINFAKRSDVQRKHTYLGAMDDMKDVISESVADDGKSVESTIIYKEKIKQLREAMLLLPERDRQLLEYKYILNMNDAEIAGHFSIKPASVREYLTRARRKALKIMKEGGISSAT